MSSSEPDSALRTTRLQQVVDSARPPLPRSPRPILIVGAGGIVRSAHLPAYRMAGFPIIGFVDRDASRARELAAEVADARSFSSLEESVAYAPADVVFDVAVPASQLLDLLPRLPRGVAVLMQKPMGETLDEARAIRALCRERGFTAAVNFQLRYAPAHLGAVALAREGVLGEVHDMEIQVRTYTPWHLWTFLAKAPRLEILYHSIHYLDLARAWFGTPRGVYAKTVRHPANPSLAATKSVMILDYGEMRRVFIATQHGHDLAHSSQRSFVQWEGTEGAMRMGMGVNLDYPRGEPDTLDVVERAQPGEWTRLGVSGSWFPEAFAGSMGSLQSYVEGSSPELPTSVESAFETMALVEAAYRSSGRGGEPLPLEASEL